MPLTVSFSPASLNAQQYDEVIRQLDEAGASSPEGRLYHVCYGEGDKMRVTEIWDSMQTFESFGSTLMPILHQVGVDPGQPEIRPTYSVIEG